MKIRLIKFRDFKIPFRAHYNDAGADIFSPAEYGLQPHSTTKIPLGFGVEIPDGFMGVIFPRSSYASRGIVAEHPPIDSGYRGEIHCVLTNMTDESFTINTGDRIGQLVIIPIVIADFVENLTEERKENGFGSSGK